MRSIDPAQVARYLFVGGGTALLYYTSIWLLHDLARAHSLIAVTVAYVFAIAFHFTANRILTFNAHHPVGRQIPRYVILAVFNYLVMAATVQLVSWLGLSVYLGATLGIGMNVAIGFIGMKYWVFAEPPAVAANQ